MAEISFALIKSDNLKKYGAFSIKQTETVIELPGKIDSSTQQAIRDKVAPVFNRLRDELNDHIADMRGKIEKALEQGKSQVQLKKVLGKDIADRVDKLDSMLQKAVPLVLQKDEELSKLVAESLLKLKVKSAWDIGNLLWEGRDAGVAIGTAIVTGDVDVLATVRGCISIVKAIMKTLDSIDDMQSEEAELRKQLNVKLKELSKIKPTAKVPSSLVDEIERLLRTYPLRVAEVQQSVKPLAGQLDELLDKTEKATFPNDKQQQAVENSIKKLINKVIHINVYSESGRKLAASAKEAANEAKSRRATDWNRVWGVMNDLYDQFCDLEGKMEIDSILKLFKEEAKESLEEWMEIEDEFDT